MVKLKIWRSVKSLSQKKDVLVIHVTTEAEKGHSKTKYVVITTYCYAVKMT